MRFPFEKSLFDDVNVTRVDICLTAAKRDWYDSGWLRFTEDAWIATRAIRLWCDQEAACARKARGLFQSQLRERLARWFSEVCGSNALGLIC